MANAFGVNDGLMMADGGKVGNRRQASGNEKRGQVTGVAGGRWQVAGGRWQVAGGREEYEGNTFGLKNRKIRYPSSAIASPSPADLRRH